MVVDIVKSCDRFVIYGAQVVAYGTYVAIDHLIGRKPVCFAVGKSTVGSSCPTGNPDEIDGIPVCPIENIQKDTLIIVGVTELIQKEVLPYLSESGFRSVFPITQHEEHLLMSEYYKSMGLFPVADKTDRRNINDCDFVLYEVMSEMDKPLNQHPVPLSYEQSIQAGASRAESVSADVTDDTGVNISDKNRMYCEMSAVYWIWKNTAHDWVGIEHYRRHLLVKPEMLGEDVDVIMPLPYICYPHEVAQFLRFTTEDVLNALFDTLKELHPTEYEDYHKILYGRYQYTYNLLCAKRFVFDDYCSWFFEITEYMEREFGKKVPELMETRAFSYVAEMLTNLYFMYHRKNLRIRHVEKAIYT